MPESKRKSAKPRKIQLEPVVDLKPIERHASIPGRGILHVKQSGEETTVTLTWYGNDGKQRTFRCTEI